jgi:hypothetical protein
MNVVQSNKLSILLVQNSKINLIQQNRVINKRATIDEMSPQTGFAGDLQSGQ